MSPLALSLRLLLSQPDAKLTALARDGNEAAFEAIVRRYRRELLSYCRRLGASPATAEDVLQQALLQAWRSLAAGAEVRDTRAWLYRIVHNATVSGLRGMPPPAAPLPDAPASGLAVEQEVEDRLAARETLAHLSSLPELQRAVMLGAAVEGLSHDELAASLGVSTGSVRGLLYRARATLRAAAAALMPAPVLQWALRRASAGGRDPARSLLDALGGGTAATGIALKSGAVITVAALAGAGIVASHAPSRQAAPHRAAAPARPRSPAAQSGPAILAAVLPAKPPARAVAEGSPRPESSSAASAPTRSAVEVPQSHDAPQTGGGSGADRYPAAQEESGSGTARSDAGSQKASRPERSERSDGTSRIKSSSPSRTEASRTTSSATTTLSPSATAPSQTTASSDAPSSSTAASADSPASNPGSDS